MNDDIYCFLLYTGYLKIKDSQKAARQIEEKQYSKDFLKLGYLEVLGYGISFYKKQFIITKA